MMKLSTLKRHYGSWKNLRVYFASSRVNSLAMLWEFLEFWMLNACLYWKLDLSKYKVYNVESYLLVLTLNAWRQTQSYSRQTIYRPVIYMRPPWVRKFWKIWLTLFLLNHALLAIRLDFFHFSTYLVKEKKFNQNLLKSDSNRGVKCVWTKTIEGE